MRTDMSFTMNVHDPKLSKVYQLSTETTFIVEIGDGGYSGISLFFTDAEGLRKFAADLYLTAVDVIRDKAA